MIFTFKKLKILNIKINKLVIGKLSLRITKIKKKKILQIFKIQNNKIFQICNKVIRI
jgi:hypothetical protein